MKNRLRFQSAFAWIVCALALLPLLLYAYLGQFSRLMSDDYCRVAIGRLLGSWGSMHHWYNVHSSSFTTYFLQGLIAPLDTLLPRITPIAIFALWLIGIYWLVIQGLTALKIERRTTKSLAVSALVVAAALSAIATEQSIFWQSAVADYLFSLALLCLNMAAVIWFVRRRNDKVTMLMGGAVAAALSLFSAGIAEMFLVIQLVFVALVLLLAIAAFPFPASAAYCSHCRRGTIGQFCQSHCPGRLSGYRDSSGRYSRDIRRTESIPSISAFQCPWQDLSIRHGSKCPGGIFVAVCSRNAFDIDVRIHCPDTGARATR